jgi:hypothetical protein
MTKLVVAFRSFANAPKKVLVPLRIMKHIREADVKLHSFLTSALDGAVVNIRLQLSYPPVKNPLPH